MKKKQIVLILIALTLMSLSTDNDSFWNRINNYNPRLTEILKHYVNNSQSQVLLKYKNNFNKLSYKIIPVCSFDFYKFKKLNNDTSSCIILDTNQCFYIIKEKNNSYYVGNFSYFPNNNMFNFRRVFFEGYTVSPNITDQLNYAFKKSSNIFLIKINTLENMNSFIVGYFINNQIKFLALGLKEYDSYSQLISSIYGSIDKYIEVNNDNIEINEMIKAKITTIDEAIKIVKTNVFQWYENNQTDTINIINAHISEINYFTPLTFEQKTLLFNKYLYLYKRNDGNWVEQHSPFKFAMDSYLDLYLTKSQSCNYKSTRYKYQKLVSDAEDLIRRSYREDIKKNINKVNKPDSLDKIKYKEIFPESFYEKNRLDSLVKIKYKEIFKN